MSSSSRAATSGSSTRRWPAASAASSSWHRDEIKLEGKLQPEINPASAVMFAFRTFLNHFAVELVVRGAGSLRQEHGEVVGEISHILRHGMLRPGA